MTPPPSQDGTDLGAWVEAHRARIVKLADGRLNIPAEIAAHGGAQHLVRQRPRLDADLPGRRRGAAHHPAAALPRAERHRHLRRRQRPADPRPRALRPPAEPRGRLADEPRRADRADRRLGRDGHRLLRRGADAAGARPRRLDVHRAQPLHRPRRQRRPGGAGPRLPLRDARRPAAALGDRPRGRLRGARAAAPPRHARRGRGGGRAQVRRRRPVRPEGRRTLQGERARSAPAPRSSTPRRSRSPR